MMKRSKGIIKKKRDKYRKKNKVECAGESTYVVS